MSATRSLVAPTDLQLPRRPPDAADAPSAVDSAPIAPSANPSGLSSTPCSSKNRTGNYNAMESARCIRVGLDTIIADNCECTFGWVVAPVAVPRDTRAHGFMRMVFMAKTSAHPNGRFHQLQCIRMMYTTKIHHVWNPSSR